MPDDRGESVDAATPPTATVEAFKTWVRPFIESENVPSLLDAFRAGWAARTPTPAPTLEGLWSDRFPDAEPLFVLLEDCRGYITPTISTHEELTEILGWCDCGYCQGVPLSPPAGSVREAAPPEPGDEEETLYIESHPEFHASIVERLGGASPVPEEEPQT